MASDRSSNPPPPIPGAKSAGRTSPVLVPQGALEGQPEIPLNRPVTTVGSAESARLHLLSRTVSKAHAIFVNSGGGTYVADLASRTGTLVNGKMVRDAELKNGDRVQIGKFVFRYRMPANLSAAVQPVEAPPAAVIVVGWPALPIPGRAVSIGREQRADIALSDDAAVSASHAVVFQVDGQWVIRDMGSRTGTLINGKKIHQQALNFGDRVTIGSSSILFQPGVSVEEEFPASVAEEEISEPVEADSLEEVLPAASIAEDEISFADEPSIAVDWKAAFPATEAEATPLEEETLKETVEGITAAATGVPVEEVAADADEIPLADESPAESIEWAATPAADLPAIEHSAVADEKIDWEFPIDEVPSIEPTTTESKAASLEALEPVADEPIANEVNWDDVADIEVPLDGISSEPVAEAAIAVTEEFAGTSAEEVADLEISEVAPPAIPPNLTQDVEAAIPLLDSQADDRVQLEAPTFKPEMVLDEESAGDSVDWNATVATDLPNLEADKLPLEEIVQPAVAIIEPLSEIEELASEIQTPVSAAHEPIAAIVEENLIETESATADAIASAAQPQTPLVEETAEWNATVAVDTTPVEIPLAEAPAVAPAAETSAATETDRAAPLEEFVFVPADSPVDPNAIPDVLFWGDSESDAAAENSTTLPPVSSDAAFDAAIKESFAEQAPQISAPEQFLEEEAIALPDDLAAFSKASEETVGAYGDSVPHVETEPDTLALPGLEVQAEDLPAFIDVAAETVPEAIEADALEFFDPEINVDTSDESAIGWTAITEQDEPIGQEQITLSQDAEVDPAADADLDFIDFGAEPTEVIPQTPPFIAETETPADQPVDEVPKPPAPADGPAHGPSVFGFQFEGGSFLGGMPISLHQPAPPAPSTVFDAKQTVPSGLETMTPPPVAQVPVDKASIAPKPDVVPMAPVKANRPMTPPRPALGSVGTGAGPTALTGLVSEARTPWSGPPIIPPTARSNASKAPTKIRQRMTTAFAAPGAAPRTAEVFSQMAAPIGVEVFGGKPGNPDQFTVPDSKETAAELAKEAAASTTPVVSLPEPKKPRKSRLPWLVGLFVLIPAMVWTIMYLVPPISSRLVSAKLTGSLTFDGLTSLNPIDAVNFHKEQEKRLLFNSEDIRLRAQTILEKENQPSGFIANADDFGKAVDSRYLNWSGNTLQLTYNTNQITSGGTQVNAVLAALAERDRDLNQAKASARTIANNARVAVDETAAKIQVLTEQHRKLTEQAQDSPDLVTVSDSDQDAATLSRKRNEAKAIRQNSEAILADLRHQDMSKPIDIEADPQVVDLKKRLDPLNEQITRLKGISAVSGGVVPAVGTNIPEGATTQPTGEVDPLLAPLQQQADLLNKKLEQRRTELAPDASMSPAQREVNMAARIENLSVKITALQKAENDLKIAADAANAKAAEYHARMSAASLAGVRANEVYGELTQAGLDHTHAVNAQTDAEAVLANCVTVANVPSGPLVPLSTTDLRRPIAAGFSALSCFVLGLMIAGELRRPKLMAKGATPAAAPLVHPPARVIPWPDQTELNDNNDPPVVGEPDQVFGGV